MLTALLDRHGLQNKKIEIEKLEQRSSIGTKGEDCASFSGKMGPNESNTVISARSSVNVNTRRWSP
jgi:hypothetical protein